MLNKIRRILPHVAILICNMYIVFFLIDRVNSAMNFIDNNLTKGLLLILCVVGLFNFREALRQERAARRPAAPRQRSRAAYEEPRPVRRSYDADGSYSYARRPSDRGTSAPRGDYGYGASDGYRSQSGYRSSTSARRYTDDDRQASRGYRRDADSRSRRY